MAKTTFDSGDDTDKSKKETAQAAKITENAKNTWKSLRDFLTDLLNIAHDTDKERSIEDIQKDIPFKGHTAWILIFSIFVASIGLNANSTAVVIGAMLISPLMGPIVGMGLSIAINDIDTLKRSLINFGVMVVLSVFTAFLFFYIFPLRDESSELLARTAPDVRDVLIAFFGGLALVVAKTKRGTLASVIFGVAIATALMPPLCTAGFGLAIGNFEYFFGAMYLFTINTIFIALATFLVLKLLRFPMKRYANSKRRKRIAQLASLVAILVTAPAIYTFVNVLERSNFENSAKRFIKEEFGALPNSSYIKRNATYTYNDDGSSSIEVSTFGLDEIPEETLHLLEKRLEDYNALSKTKLVFNQTRNKEVDEMRYMEELRMRDSLELMSQSDKITFLENKVKELSKLERNTIPFSEITQELEINYEELKNFSYAGKLVTNFKTVDTIPEFTVAWKDSIPIATRQKKKTKLEEWLKYKLKFDTLIIKTNN